MNIIDYGQYDGLGKWTVTTNDPLFPSRIDASPLSATVTEVDELRKELAELKAKLAWLLDA